MRTTILAAALLLPMAAAAQNNSNNNVGGWHVQTGPNAPNSPRAAALSAAAATTGASSSSAGGSSSSVAFSDRLQAPGLASYAAPSGPCVGVSTFATGSVAGFGIGGGRSEIEDECQVREAARLLHAMGATGEALALIRNLPSVRRAMPQAPAPAPITVAHSVPSPAAEPVSRPAWCDTASGPERTRVAYQQECAR